MVGRGFVMLGRGGRGRNRLYWVSRFYRVFVFCLAYVGIFLLFIFFLRSFAGVGGVFWRFFLELRE